MTRKQDEKNAPSGAERATRRGLGTDAERRSTTATGEFPLEWPQLPESPECVFVEPTAVHDDEVTSSWQRPQSRGPEYHPPALPAAARERAAPGTGTFRVGASPSPPARWTPAQEADAATRPSSVPPFERPVGRSSALPARARFAGKRFWWPVAAGLVFGSVLALTLVRVPVRAWGVLKASGAPEVLSSQLSGSVAQLRVAAGDRVEPGDVIAEIRSPELESNLEGRRAELEWLHQELDGAAREEQAAQARSLNALARRRSLLEERLALKDAESEQRTALLDTLSVRAAGAAPAYELVEATAAMQAAREARLGIVDELAQLDLELSDRRSAEQVRERARRSRLADAEARLRQANAALSFAAVRAPASGWVESLLVSPGSSVQPGAEVARLVPFAPPRSVLALVASEDAAEVSVGETASVELAPYHGSAAVFAARIRYVSREVAPASRVQTILGAPSAGGFVQLELELLDSSEYQALESQLRSGWRALVSLDVPRRSLGSVLVHTLRQWWDFELWG